MTDQPRALRAARRAAAFEPDRSTTDQTRVLRAAIQAAASANNDNMDAAVAPVVANKDNVSANDVQVWIVAAAAAAAITAAKQQQALMYAAVATAVAAQQPQPSMPPPVVFSLSPGSANPYTPWNCSSSEGIQWPSDKGQRSLKVLLSRLTSKAKQFGWKQIMMVPDNTGVVISMLEQYALLITADVKTHALTYIGLYPRASQASAQLAECILASMDDMFFLEKLLARVNDYTMKGVEDGTIKAVIFIKKMRLKEVESDIAEFKLQLSRGLMNQIRAVSEDYSELLDKLLQAYQNASDETFVTYIAEKRSRSTAFPARKTSSNLDTLRLEKATHDPETKGFREAMRAEIASLDRKGTWNVITRNEATSKVRPGTWTFNTKRPPDGRIKKLEARYCVQGDMLPDILCGASMALAGYRYKMMIMRKNLNAATKEESEIIHMRAEAAEMIVMYDKSTKTKKNAVPKGGGRGKNRYKVNAKWAWISFAPTGDQAKEKSFEGTDCVYGPFHQGKKWLLKRDHGNGCRKDTKMKSLEPPAKSTEPSKKTLQYAKVLINVMDAEEDYELVDETLCRSWNYLCFLLPIMILLFLISPSRTMLSHVIEWAENQYETETVLSHIFERASNWAKKTIVRNAINARTVRASLVNVGTVSFWAYGEDEIWALAILAVALMYIGIRFLIGPPHDKKKRSYVPRRCRKPSKIVPSVKLTCNWSTELITRKLAKSHTYRLLAAYMDAWWRGPRSERQLGRFKTGYNSKSPSNRYHRMVRKRDPVCTYRKWDSYSRHSRYFDAGKAHSSKANQYDGSEHPKYFDATQSETEGEAYQCEFSDAMQFGESDHEDEEMYAEFIDADLPPDDDEDIELPTDSVDAMTTDRSASAQREDHGYDSDSFWTAASNCCSECIANCLSEFEDEEMGVKCFDTSIHTFCNQVGGIEPLTLEENALYYMPVIEVSEDELSNLDPDGTGGNDCDFGLGLEGLTDCIHSDILGQEFARIKRTGMETIIPEDEHVHRAIQCLIAWHDMHGHTLFAKIKQTTARGDLPRNIATAKTPKCAARQKAMQQAWKSKSLKSNLTTPPATSPGTVVAVDRTIAATQGFIARMRCFIARKLNAAIAVLVDHFCELSFVVLQKLVSLQKLEIVEAKRYATTHGVKIRHYRAGNAIFAETEVVKAVEVDQQSISYCAVTSTIEKLRQVAASHQTKHSCTVGSPGSVLATRVQAGRSLPNWNQKPRDGMYSRRVSFILNLWTGRAFQQVHVIFDDLFETLRPSDASVAPTSPWLTQTGLVRGKDSGRTGKRAKTQGAQQSDPFIGIIPSSDVTPNRVIDAPSDDELVIDDQQRQDHYDLEIHTEVELGDNATHKDETTPSEATKSRTRAGRVAKPTQKCMESVKQPDGMQWSERGGKQLDEGLALDVSWEVLHDGGYQIQDVVKDSIACAASLNPDTMYNDRVMKESDSKRFEQDMLGHRASDCWLNEDTKAKKRSKTWKDQETTSKKGATAVDHGKGLKIELLWCTMPFPSTQAALVDPSVWIGSNAATVHMAQLQWATSKTRREPRSEIFLERSVISMETKLVERFIKMLQLLTSSWKVTGENNKLEMKNHDHEAVFVNAIPTPKGVVYAMYVQHGSETACMTKARLSDHFGKRERGVKYWETISPSVSWSTIRLYLTMSILNKWCARRGEFVLAISQTVIECPMFMKISRAFKFSGSRRTRCLSLKWDQQAGWLWNKNFHDGIVARRYRLSEVVSVIKRLGKHLLRTKDKDMILNPRHSFDCFCGADLCRKRDRVNAYVDPLTAKSRTGYVITYASCQIMWADKLQPYVALSTTEVDCGALSTSLRDMIHMMQIVKEARALGWKTFEGKPSTVHCKVFEDNAGALEARLPKVRARTKCLSIRMHRFREHVRNGDINVNKIPTRDQLVDIATKPQPEDLSVSQRESPMQWQVKFTTKEELSLPAHQLRACDISEQALSLCGDGQPEDAVRTEQSLTSSLPTGT
jgi:hypothetical protein